MSGGFTKIAAENPLFLINALVLLLIGFFLASLPIVTYLHVNGRSLLIIAICLVSIFVFSFVAGIYQNFSKSQNATKIFAKAANVYLPEVPSDFKMTRKDVYNDELTIEYTGKERNIRINEKNESQAKVISCSYFGLVNSSVEIEKRNKERNVPSADCKIVEVNGNKAAFYYMRDYAILGYDLYFKIILISQGTFIYMEAHGCSQEAKSCGAFTEKEFLDLASSFKRANI